MNIEKLKHIEQCFFEIYPDGFSDPGLAAVMKRHNVSKLVTLSQECFNHNSFISLSKVTENMVKIISRSSLISFFEKPRFRDAVKAMSLNRKNRLSTGLQKMLHGRKESGFQIMIDVLLDDKLAKWSIISVLPYYYAPTENFFIKPVTTKNIIAYFEIEDLVYTPRPYYDFYQRYTEIIEIMKNHVDKSLTVDNAQFTGFLMMGMELQDEKKVFS